ncbi:uncharacterized protein LOC106089260 isoform X1 [Stomoxys calcitrans]|uniref:uncharacterized protein LOC106089260 isoform X1 n=2 Tax=Stomoxys calcitrans TaxID=35570 RepID=UPI0027E2BC65|nr:uncharacterized protein LOC106089260 isoform X1 [Stomoxys calcitrans]
MYRRMEERKSSKSDAKHQNSSEGRTKSSSSKSSSSSSKSSKYSERSNSRENSNSMAIQKYNPNMRFIRKSVETPARNVSTNYLELETEFPRDYDDNIEMLSREAEHLEEQFRTPTRTSTTDLSLTTTATETVLRPVTPTPTRIVRAEVVEINRSKEPTDSPDKESKSKGQKHSKRVGFKVEEKIEEQTAECSVVAKGTSKLSSIEESAQTQPSEAAIPVVEEPEVVTTISAPESPQAGEQKRSLQPASKTSSTTTPASTATTVPVAITTSSAKDDDDEPVAMSPCGRFFKYDKEVGRGSFKTVYRGLDTETGVAVAWCELLDKQVKKSERKRFREEADMLKKLQHPNIVRFYTYWEFSVARKKNIVLVTELMLSGTLKSYLKRFKKINPKVLKSWCRQILKGLHFLHTRPLPIIHRDLKCDNIFITGTTGSVKIGDLGLATLKNRSHAKSVIGTPEFMAPEMYEEHYDESVDVYAFGMCMLEMAVSEYPYSECKGPAQIYKKVISGIKPAAMSKVEDPKVREIIEKCIELKKEDRPKCKDLLNSEFFEEDIGIRVEATSTETFLENPDNNVIEFRLRFLDPKKRSSKHKENEAIQFEYDVKNDDCERVCDDMKQENIITEEDARAIVRLLKVQVFSLLKERVQRQTQFQLQNEKSRLEKIALQKQREMLPENVEEEEEEDEADSEEDEDGTKASQKQQHQSQAATQNTQLEDIANQQQRPQQQLHLQTQQVAAQEDAVNAASATMVTSPTTAPATQPQFYNTQMALASSLNAILQQPSSQSFAQQQQQQQPQAASQTHPPLQSQQSQMEFSPQQQQTQSQLEFVAQQQQQGLQTQTQPQTDIAPQQNQVVQQQQPQLEYANQTSQQQQQQPQPQIEYINQQPQAALQQVSQPNQTMQQPQHEFITQQSQASLQQPQQQTQPQYDFIPQQTHQSQNIPQQQQHPQMEFVAQPTHQQPQYSYVPQPTQTLQQSSHIDYVSQQSQLSQPHQQHQPLQSLQPLGLSNGIEQVAAQVPVSTDCNQATNTGAIHSLQQQQQQTSQIEYVTQQTPPVQQSHQTQPEFIPQQNQMSQNDFVAQSTPTSQPQLQHVECTTQQLQPQTQPEFVSQQQTPPVQQVQQTHLEFSIQQTQPQQNNSHQSTPPAQQQQTQLEFMPTQIQPQQPSQMEFIPQQTQPSQMDYMPQQTQSQPQTSQMEYLPQQNQSQPSQMEYIPQQTQSQQPQMDYMPPQSQAKVQAQLPQVEYISQQTQPLSQPTQIEYIPQQTQPQTQPSQMEYIPQQSQPQTQPSQVEYIAQQTQPPHMEYIPHQTQTQQPQMEYIPQQTQTQPQSQPHQMEYIPQQTQAQTQPNHTQPQTRPAQMEYIPPPTQSQTQVQPTQVMTQQTQSQPQQPMEYQSQPSQSTQLEILTQHSQTAQQPEFVPQTIYPSQPVQQQPVNSQIQFPMPVQQVYQQPQVTQESSHESSPSVQLQEPAFEAKALNGNNAGGIVTLPQVSVATSTTITNGTVVNTMENNNPPNSYQLPSDAAARTASFSESPITGNVVAPLMQQIVTPDPGSNQQSLASAASTTSATFPTSNDIRDSSTLNDSETVSRKTSTASEYTTISSDYSPENTITPNSVFPPRHLSSQQYFEIGQNSDFLLHEYPNVNIIKDSLQDIRREDVGNVSSDECATENSSPPYDVRGNPPMKSNTPDGSVAGGARKISRFYVNPVVLPSATAMEEGQGQATGENKTPSGSSETGVAPNANGTLTSAPLYVTPSGEEGSNAPTLATNGNANHSLEQLKIELENITHAQAFASAIVASINSDHLQQHNPTQQQLTPIQQQQQQLNVQTDDDTPTGPLSSTRTTSTFNSRRTSLDNSGCNELQNAVTHLGDFNDVNGVTLLAPNQLQTSLQPSLQQNTIPETFSQSSLSSEPIVNIFERIEKQQLSKQNSLESNTQFPPLSSGSVDSTITTNTNTQRLCGLSQTSIADLEKKLAALRNVELTDEMLVEQQQTENELNARRVSRFCVSRVQEAASSEQQQQGASTAEQDTTPTQELQQPFVVPVTVAILRPTIDLQAANTLANNSFNTPTELLSPSSLTYQPLGGPLTAAKTAAAVVLPLQQSQAAPVYNIEPAAQLQQQLQQQIQQQLQRVNSMQVEAGQFMANFPQTQQLHQQQQQQQQQQPQTLQQTALANHAGQQLQQLQQQHIPLPFVTPIQQQPTAMHPYPYISHELIESAQRLSLTSQEDNAMSLAATHPNLLPTVIQSDIKHNLDSLVSQLCSTRLGTTQHQRLLLLRQRQLIEEDELRLKHYVEYEKFQKAMRQSSSDMVHPQQAPMLYIQPTTINQQGYINLTSGFMPNFAGGAGGHSYPQHFQQHHQQHLINANVQTSAMSGYAVMINPQLAATAPIQQQPQAQQQHQQQFPQYTIVGNMGAMPNQHTPPPNATATGQTPMSKQTNLSGTPLQNGIIFGQE